MIQGFRFFISLLFCLFSFWVSGQKTLSLIEGELLYKNGLELFDKHQFGAAQKTFQNYTERSQVELVKTDAYYYLAACGIELFNKDGEWMMKLFIQKTNPTPN